MKSDYTLSAPEGHASSCGCRACLNIAWLRATQAGSDPVMLPVAHSADCPCPICANQALRRLPLIDRFRAAALPGDLQALLIGTKLGVAMAAVAIIAHERHAIAAVLAALW